MTRPSKPRRGPRFRDDDQRRRACHVLVSSQGLEWLWSTERGPTAKALLILQAAPDDQLAKGQRVVLFVAWAIWKNEPWMFDKVLDDSLDIDQIVLVMTLAIAIRHSVEMIDVWLLHYEKRRVLVH